LVRVAWVLVSSSMHHGYMAWGMPFGELQRGNLRLHTERINEGIHTTGRRFTLAHRVCSRFCLALQAK
jgi:hypothetical protein